MKGRVDNCILKRRCGVRRDAVVPLLNGQWPAADQFFTTEPRHFEALERFLLLTNSLNARPKAHNAYLREAWVSPHDNSVRILGPSGETIATSRTEILNTTYGEMSEVTTPFKEIAFPAAGTYTAVLLLDGKKVFEYPLEITKD